MAKRNNKKPKLVRSSSIQKTIDEGKDYVNREDRRLRIRRNNKTTAATPKLQARKQKKITKVTKPKVTKASAQKKKVAARGVQKRAVPAVPVASAPLFAPVPPPVVRTASRNLSRSGSRVGTGNVAGTGSTNNQIIIEQQLQDRLGRNKANIGKLNFSLRWWDPNDLDLHVICPCNTQISFMNKKCVKCGGQLDIDMNVGLNMSLEPVEHVYFNHPKSGLYKFYVQYYSGPKQYMGVKGTQKSKYALSLHEDLNQIFRYEDTVSITQRQMHYDFNR